MGNVVSGLRSSLRHERATPQAFLDEGNASETLSLASHTSSIFGSKDPEYPQHLVSELIQVLCVINTHAPSSAPALPCLSGLRLRREHFALQSLALFLVVDSEGDETAVTNLWTRRGLEYVVAKNRPLREDDHEALARLNHAIQNYKDLKSLYEVVIQNCHSKMNKELNTLIREACSEQGFAEAVEAYRRSSSRSTGMPIEKFSGYYDSRESGLQAYMKRIGTTDVFEALNGLYHVVLTQAPSAIFPVPLPVDPDSLSSLCKRWHAVSNDIIALVRSDFLERMTREEEVVEGYNRHRLLALKALRYNLFRVALYGLSVIKLGYLIRDNPSIPAQIVLRWLVEPQPEVQGLTLARDAVTSVRTMMKSFYMRVTHKERFDAIFNKATSWTSHIQICRHPELKLLQYVLAEDPLLAREGSRIHPKVPQALCSSGTTCFLCATCIAAVNDALPVVTRVVLTSPQRDGIVADDIDWRYTPLEPYAHDVSSHLVNRLKNLLRSAEFFH